MNVIIKMIKFNWTIRMTFLIAIASFIGCTSSTYHFYSPSKDQCTTIITNNNIRYIIAGKYNSIPDSNFVKLDITKTDRNVGDQVIGCWRKGDLKWVVMMNHVSIIENKLDMKKFMFKTDFPVGKYDVPN